MGLKPIKEGLDNSRSSNWKQKKFSNPKFAKQLKRLCLKIGIFLLRKIRFKIWCFANATLLKKKKGTKFQWESIFHHLLKAFTIASQCLFVCSRVIEMVSQKEEHGIFENETKENNTEDSPPRYKTLTIYRSNFKNQEQAYSSSN